MILYDNPDQMSAMFIPGCPPGCICRAADRALPQVQPRNPIAKPVAKPINDPITDCEVGIKSLEDFLRTFKLDIEELEQKSSELKEKYTKQDENAASEALVDLEKKREFTPRSKLT